MRAGDGFTGAGELRHSVTIERKASGTPNAFGEPDGTWERFAIVRAKIAPKSATEFWAAQQPAAAAYFTLTIRHLPGVDPKMRIIWGGRVLNISGIRNPNSRSRFLEIDAWEAS